LQRLRLVSLLVQSVLNSFQTTPGIVQGILVFVNDEVGRYSPGAPLHASQPLSHIASNC